VRIIASKGNFSEGAFGGAIGLAVAPVVEERCEGRPPTMFGGGEVVDGFGDAVVFRPLAALCDQPAAQTFDQWAGSFMSRGQACACVLAIDFTLNIEDRVDPFLRCLQPRIRSQPIRES
jgi:hypothetical protein